MPWYRYAVRGLVALASFAVVAALMVAAFTAVALAIDWDIPDASELLGPSSVFDRNGVPLARLAAEIERRPVPLDRISPHLADAVIATEDHRFREHQGVDPLSVVRAVVSNVRYGGIREGGSTLTQQFVKNVYVGADQTFSRKVQEALVALQLEKELTKDEILEAYLNRVYFGDGAYGAEAAALTYFGKPAADLTVAEAATLAGVLTAPSRFSPRTDPAGAIERRDRVLDEMATYGFLTRTDAQFHKRDPLNIAPREPFRTAAPFFIEEVRRQLLDTYGAELVYNGGLVITTSIDVRRQEELEQQVLADLPPDERFDAGVAVVMPSTGDVLAAYSGRSFEQSQVDLALSPFFGRPSGSTFKVFGLAAALEQGMTLATTYPAPASVTIGTWSPKGGGGCGGRCSLLEATVRSSNTVFAQVARDVGAEAFIDAARRMGVRRPMAPEHGLAQILGTADVSPLDLASAVGTLANDGVACPARVVIDVRHPDGSPVRTLPDPRMPSQEEREQWAAYFDWLGYDFGNEDLGPRCYRALPPSIARHMTAALQQAVVRGTGRGAALEDRPVAGKTGTAQRNTEAWFAGYTTDLAIAVALFDPSGQTRLEGIPGCGEVCFGGQLPATIFANVAALLHRDIVPREFPEPIEDEREVPDRRRLGPGMPRPAPPPAEPTLEPTVEPTGPATASPTFEPLPPVASPLPPTSPRPQPGLLGPLFPPQNPPPSPSPSPTGGESGVAPPGPSDPPAG
jgi:penicillin-binding protein 1A